MSSKNSGVAERYAAALFELAHEGKLLDQVAAEAKALKAMMAESADLRRFLTSPIFSRAVQEKAIGALAVKAEFSDLMRRFLGLVARQRRLTALGAMLDAFAHRLAVLRGEMVATVVAAQPLSDQALADIKAALTKTAGGKVALSVEVDPGLLGGLVVRVGSRMLDSSLKTKLQHLKLAMKGVG